jgi:signal transduction histidine kinase
MTDEYILVPHSWRRGLNISRIALAVACIAIEVLSPQPAPALTRILLICFLLHGVIASLWRILHRVRYAMFSLAIDSIFFLICATIRSEYSAWVSALFYLYLISSALLIHPTREVAIVASVLPLLFALVLPSEFYRMLPVLLLAGALGLVAARNRQLLIDRLISTSRKAVLYRAEAQQARDQERERIAADFHDGPQQSFISLQMRLEVIRRLLERDPAKAAEELAQLQELTRQQVAEVRAFVRSMRPAAIEGASLPASIGRLVHDFEKETGIATSFHTSECEVENSELAGELFHIVREALHNTQKHAGASRVHVDLARTNGAVRIAVEDNGSGFAFAGRFDLDELDALFLGPASIKRRVRSLNGALLLNSQPGRGSVLEIRIPIP